MKIAIIEANEIPPKIFEWYSALRPHSAIADILQAAGGLIRTRATDVTEEFLYPSQTWASFNTGQPFDQHNVHWYNDPKTYEDFFWLRAAKSGKKTVLVNTLHSSPLNKFPEEKNLVCVIPDCFAADCQTIPTRYENFQTLNVFLARENGRKASIKQTLLAALGAWIAKPSLRYWGLSFASAKDIGRTVLSALSGRPERLRNAQFPLVAQIFLTNLEEHNPDLAVLFTNHVAANMHRYWYAAFPNDYPAPAYPSEWQEKYRNEILYAMDLLDSWLEKYKRWCLRNDTVMLITTSMGQCANTNLSSDVVGKNRYGYRIFDPIAFLKFVGITGAFHFEGAMVPQYTYSFDSSSDIAAAVECLHAYATPQGKDGIVLELDQSGFKLTLTVDVLSPDSDVVEINPLVYNSAAGLKVFEIDDHHSGRHHPIGSLLFWNDLSGLLTKYVGKELDYLQVNPLIAEISEAH